MTQDPKMVVIDKWQCQKCARTMAPVVCYTNPHYSIKMACVCGNEESANIVLTSDRIYHAHILQKCTEHSEKQTVYAIPNTVAISSLRFLFHQAELAGVRIGDEDREAVRMAIDFLQKG